MADKRHIENRYLVVTQQSIVQFSEILRGDAVLHRISAMKQIPAFHKTFL